MRPIVVCLRIARPRQRDSRGRQAGREAGWSPIQRHIQRCHLRSRTLVPARLTQSDPLALDPGAVASDPVDENRVSINHAGVRLDSTLHAISPPHREEVAQQSVKPSP